MHTMLKRHFAASLIAGLFVVPMASELRIGYVDLDRILSEAGPAIKALKKLEREFAQRGAEIKRLEDQSRALQAELDRAGGTMPESDRRTKERDLLKMQQDLSLMKRTYREDIGRRRAEELSGLQERVTTVIQQLGQREKYDFILQDALYKNPKLDITDKVLKALDDK
jgi:outer membrane protein